jgi:hypothetical protein
MLLLLVAALDRLARFGHQRSLLSAKSVRPGTAAIEAA